MGWWTTRSAGRFSYPGHYGKGEIMAKKPPPQPKAGEDIKAKDIEKYVKWGLKHGEFKGPDGRAKLYALMVSLHIQPGKK
jgi:hypothetical protein